MGPYNPEDIRSAPHVALLVETSLGPGRDILRGISHYLGEHGPWALYHEPRSLAEGPPKWLATWRGDGIIARVQNREIADAVKATGLPVVDVLGVEPGTGLPLVHVDNRLIAAMASEHLLERGFHHFGFFGIKGENWSEQRREEFCQCLQPFARSVAVREVPRSDLGITPWGAQEEALAQWLAGLPKPIGFLVASDQLGPHLLEGCRRAGIRVPDEVGVVSVDNDETLCEVCHPSLSSVKAGHCSVGYKAASLLASMMNGESPSAEPTLVHPQSVVARGSSEVQAAGDRLTAVALRIIREQACSGLSAADLIAQIPVSRSALQRRFRRETGRSIQEEIINERLKRARQLLAETNLPLAVVADRAGFRHQEYLGAVMKAHFDKTPLEYRMEASLLFIGRSRDLAS